MTQFVIAEGRGMPRQHSTGAARHIVENAATELPIDLIAELAEPLAEYMLVDYERTIGKTAQSSRRWPALQRS
jgi:hypothetical protein